MKYKLAPEFAAAVDTLPRLDFANPLEARRQMSEMLAMANEEIDESGVLVEDETLERPEDGSGLTVRIYRPLALNNTETVPAILGIHGGGYVIGSLESEHGILIAMCRELGVIIVSVDYRLAPEYPYPAGLEDCYTALRWMSDNAVTLGLDAGRIAIMGHSAGGGMSAALALLAKQRGGPVICFQYLGIPEIDDRLQTGSMQAFVDTPVWDRGNTELSWKHYLGERSQTSDLPVTAAPARARDEDLQGLPPALVTTMEFDPLRDEGILYAMRMMQAGVNVELHCYPGAFHGATLLIDSPVSRQANRDGLNALRRGLGLDG